MLPAGIFSSRRQLYTKSSSSLCPLCEASTRQIPASLLSYNYRNTRWKCLRGEQARTPGNPLVWSCDPTLSKTIFYVPWKVVDATVTKERNVDSPKALSLVSLSMFFPQRPPPLDGRMTKAIQGERQTLQRWKSKHVFKQPIRVSPQITAVLDDAMRTSGCYFL